MSKNDEKRITVRLSEAEYDRIKHFAQREDISVNQFVIDSTNHYADWILKDFDVPTAEVKRLNQIVEAVNRLNDTNSSLTELITSVTESFYTMTNTKDLFSQDKGGDK